MDTVGGESPSPTSVTFATSTKLISERRVGSGRSQKSSEAYRGRELRRGLGLFTFAVHPGAGSVELHPMMLQPESVRLGDRVLPLFQALVEELNDLAAIHADNVIVVLIVALGRFVEHLPVSEAMGIGETALRKELHGSIHGGQAHLRILLADLLEKVLDGEMSAGLEKDLSDQLALPGELEPVFGDVFPQHLERVTRRGIRRGHPSEIPQLASTW